MNSKRQPKASARLVKAVSLTTAPLVRLASTTCLRWASDALLAGVMDSKRSQSGRISLAVARLLSRSSPDMLASTRANSFAHAPSKARRVFPRHALPWGKSPSKACLYSLTLAIRSIQGEFAQHGQHPCGRLRGCAG